jgi:hypothetical protein
VQVDFREILKLLRRRVQNLPAIDAASTGIIHEDLHWAQLGGDFTETGDDGGFDSEVGDVVMRCAWAVVGVDALGHCLEFVFGAGEEGCGIAFCCEAAGDGFSDSWTGADDGHYGFVCGVEGHFLFDVICNCFELGWLCKRGSSCLAMFAKEVVLFIVIDIDVGDQRTASDQPHAEH